MICIEFLSWFLENLLKKKFILVGKSISTRPPHYRKGSRWRESQLHSKDLCKHGKGIAMRRRTTKTARQRRLCRASRENSTTKTLPCNPRFAVRRETLPCSSSLPCVLFLFRATRLCRALRNFTVRRGIVVRRGVAVLSGIAVRPTATLCRAPVV
jgi:hypothetical protein